MWVEAVAQANPRNVLLSYWYFDKQRDIEKVRGLLKHLKSKGTWILIDSGAHSFFAEYAWLDARTSGVSRKDAEKAIAARKKAGKPTDPVETIAEMGEYVERYIRWVKMFAAEGLIDAWAELDIYTMIGKEPVWRWRERWAEEGLTDGLIVTMHAYSPIAWKKKQGLAPWSGLYNGASKDDLEEAFSGKYGYVGFSNSDPAAFNMVFADYMDQMRANKVRTHGWGMTTEKAMFKQPWYSVDSASWCGFAQWGLVYYWNENKRRLDVFKKHPGKPPEERNKDRTLEFDRRGLWEEAESYGIDMDRLRAWQSPEVDIWNATQWGKLATLAEEDISDRAYWLDAEERDKMAEEKREEMNLAGALVRREFASEENVPAELLHPSQTVGRFCNTCIVKDRCPQFQKDATCVLTELQMPDSKSMMAQMAMNVLATHYERVMFAAQVERQQGGFMDPNLTGAMERLLGMMEQVKRLGDNREEITIKAKGGPGIISQLFGSLMGGADGGGGDNGGGGVIDG